MTDKEDEGIGDVNRLVAENKVLRSNLLALKRYMLAGTPQDRNEAQGGGEEEDGYDDDGVTGEPSLKRRKGIDEKSCKTPCDDCGKYQNALRSAFDQLKSAVSQCEAMKRECEAKNEAIRKLQQENAVLRRRSEEIDIQQRVASRAIQNSKEFERRSREKIESAKGALLNMRKLEEMNEILMIYLKSLLGVDSMKRFLDYFINLDDGLKAAKRLHAVEAVSRTEKLRNLCADAEKSLEDDGEQQHQGTKAKKNSSSSSLSQVITESSSSSDGAQRDNYLLAKRMIDILHVDQDEDPADVANNTAELKIPSISVCQALCSWISSWTIGKERLLGELGVAYRSPKGRKLFSKDERAVIRFIGTLSDCGEEYNKLAEQLCLILSIQALNDLEQRRWGTTRSSTQSVGHTLALISREFLLGTSPVYTFIIEMLSRCRRTSGPDVVISGVLEAVVAAWPEAFVPLCDDYFLHVLCFVLHQNILPQSEILKQIVATCHWHIATQDQLIRVLVHPKTLKSFVAITFNGDGELVVHVTDASALQCWFCSLVLMISNSSECTSLLKTAALPHGHAVQSYIESVLSVVKLH